MIKSLWVKHNYLVISITDKRDIFNLLYSECIIEFKQNFQDLFHSHLEIMAFLQIFALVISLKSK